MRCASFAIRSSFVETVVELDLSFIFPSNGSMPRCRPLLGGVPRVGSPASALVLRHSDFQLPRLARSRLLGGSGCTGESWISQVPRRPSPYVPRLSDPGGTVEAGLRDHVPTLCSAAVAFHACRRVDFHHFFSFGIQYRGPHARCLRFAARVTPAPRKTRYWLAALPWPGGSPTRSVAASGLHSRVGVHMVSS